MIVVTAEEMREMDRLTIQKYQVPSLTLMERAGEGIARAILERFGRPAKKGVLVVAGKGNNGGDGFVVARLLKKKRIPCEVALLARKEDLSPDAGHNLRAFLKLKGKVTEIDGTHLELLDQRIGKNAVIVDAILGTGMKSEVRGLFADAITLMNASGLPIVAVDIPSGLDSDRGTPLGVAIQAEMTVALGYPKLGEVIYPGLNYVGDLVVCRHRHRARSASRSGAQDGIAGARNYSLVGAPARAGYSQRHLRPSPDRRRFARQDRRGDFGVARRHAVGRGLGDSGSAAFAQ